MADAPRNQSARAYTLAEIDQMRDALSARWFRRRFPPDTLGNRGGAWQPGEREREVNYELQQCMVGNADPIDVITECAKTE